MSERAPPGLSRRILTRLWPAGAWRFRVYVIAAGILTLSAKLLAVVTPFVYKAAVDALSDKALIAAPIVLIVAYGAARFATDALASVRQLIFVGVSQEVVRLAVIDVFRHLHALSLRFHLDRRTGGLFRTIERGTFGLEVLLDLVAFEIAPTLVELVLVTAILWRAYGGALALTVLIAVTTYLAFTALATQWQAEARRHMNGHDVAASVRAVDSLLNYETVKYFTAEAEEIGRFDGARRAYQKAAVRNQLVQTLSSAGQAAIVALGLIAVSILAARGVSAHALSVGDFVLVNAYLLQVYAPLGLLGASYSHLRQSFADVEDMDALLREPVEVRDAPNAARLSAPQGRVVFDRVSFGYDPRRPILRDVSFEIPPGKTLAVVGPTGSGKSTLGRLLFRFYDVAQGAIEIDGQDIRQVTQSSLRQAIGVVPQDTVLFNDTLYANIAYGRPDVAPQEVEAAARLARIHDLIQRLPDGYQTEVGERGLKLSGGEKQRVAIARVFLRRPTVLIFDEATSALDSRTEHEIQASLREVSAHHTTLVIAHRLSTIVDADEILVLDGGRIVERGRHEALLTQRGAYAAMWTRQRKAVSATDRIH